MEVDVIIVGSGAGGLTAAVVAARLGLSVVVCEKAPYFGGTTALSLGGPWIVANKHQSGLGVADTIEAGETYLREVLGNLYDPEMISTFLCAGREMITFMEANSAVVWAGFPMPDYYPELPGASAGRTLLVDPFDGKKLGPYLKLLKRPLRGIAPFGTMQVDLREAGRFQSTFKNAASFVFTSRRLLRYGFDVLRFGSGSYLANGNALIGRLIRSALDLGVILKPSSSLEELIVNEGQLESAVFNHGGDRMTIRARRRVVLASGGFGADPKWRERYMPLADAHISVQPDTNVGDGIRLGQAAGGVLGEDNPDNGVWAPVSILRHADGRVDKYPHFGFDRGKPGSLIVDASGKRFVNEAAPYLVFGQAMHAQNVTKAWFIANRRFLRQYGMGLALPAPYPSGRLIRQGYLLEADTIQGLASKIGIDVMTLNVTIEEFNHHARDGKDPFFQRGESAYDGSQGDFGHQPNPNLAPIEGGPYYALALYPGSISSVLGLETNVNAQVLSQSGDVVRGLYAVGLDQNTVMRGTYPGGGSSIGPAMTFGYLAAKHMAEVNEAALTPSSSTGDRVSAGRYPG